MMISIERCQSLLDRRLNRVNRYLQEVVHQNNYEKVLNQAAAVFHLWQIWVTHNRAIILACLSGNLEIKGALLASPIGHLPEDQRLYHAQQYALEQNPTAGKALRSHLGEPNWGDVSKVINICSAAGFDDATRIMNCFGLAVRLNDLQLCRNTCAHIAPSQLAEFSRSRVRYKDNSFRHPSDMLNWIDPETNQRLWDSWLGEMMTITELISDP